MRKFRQFPIHTTMGTSAGGLVLSVSALTGRKKTQPNSIKAPSVVRYTINRVEPPVNNRPDSRIATRSTLLIKITYILIAGSAGKHWYELSTQNGEHPLNEKVSSYERDSNNGTAEHQEEVRRLFQDFQTETKNNVFDIWFHWQLEGLTIVIWCWNGIKLRLPTAKSLMMTTVDDSSAPTEARESRK